jgi:broad specificity phosphatase PhoE
MKAKRIILIRHGQSQGNADNAVYEETPDFAVNLTQLGREQAIAAGESVKQLIGDGSVAAYISPYYRTRQTWAGIKSAISGQVKFEHEDPRLRELDFGHLGKLEYLAKIKQERKSFSTFYYRIPDGESGADVFDRISTFLETLHRDFKKQDRPDNVVIVSHGLTSLLFLMRWFHWSVEKFESLRNPKNCQIITMEKQANGKFDLTSELEQSS